MELKIIAIGDKGKLQDERIGLQVLSSCQLKYYILFRTTLSEKGFYNRSKNAYWFVPLELKQGDKIVIYTRKGEDSVKTNDDGSKTYFFYWGLDSTIFNNSEDGVVLVQANSWQLSRNK